VVVLVTVGDPRGATGEGIRSIFSELFGSNSGNRTYIILLAERAGISMTYPGTMTAAKETAIDWLMDCLAVPTEDYMV